MFGRTGDNNHQRRVAPCPCESVRVLKFLIAVTPEIEVIGAVTRGGAHTGLGIFVSSTGFASANLGA